MLCANDRGIIDNGEFFFGRNRETMPSQGVLVQLHTAMAYVRWETSTCRPALLGPKSCERKRRRKPADDMFSDQGGAAGSVMQRVVRPATLLKTPIYVVHVHKNGPWYRALLYSNAAVASAPCFRTNDHNITGGVFWDRRLAGPHLRSRSPRQSTASCCWYRGDLMVP